MKALYTRIMEDRQATRAEIDATIATFQQVELQQRQPSKKKKDMKIPTSADQNP